MASYKEINSIVRASHILRCLSGGTGKLSDISRKLDINTETVHGTLKTLENTGIAAQDPLNRQYYLGPQIRSLPANPTTVHQVLINY